MDNWTPANEVAAFSFTPAPEPAKVQPGTATTPSSKVVSAGPEVNNPDSTKPVDFANMIGSPESLEVDAEDADRNKVFGILAYLGFFCLVPIIVAKDSPFAKYHANQGLVLFIAEIAVTVITAAFVFIPFLGTLVYFPAPRRPPRFPRAGGFSASSTPPPASACRCPSSAASS